MTLPNQPPIPGKPNLRRDTPALDQQPERPDVRHSGVDGSPLAPIKRTATMPNMAALKAPPLFEQADPPLPVPPALPAEHARTVPASAHVAPTQRAPTRASGGVVIREGAETESAPASRQGDREAILLDQLAKARAEIAKRDRDDRAAAEAKVETYPPKVAQPRTPSPAPASVSPDIDRALGKTVRTVSTRLAARFGLTPILVAIGLGGAVVAVAKPSAEPAKLEALEVRITTLEERQAAGDASRNKALQREAQRDAYIQCLLEEVSEGLAQLLPAQDRVGNAQPMRPWVERCSRLKP